MVLQRVWRLDDDFVQFFSGSGTVGNIDPLVLDAALWDGGLDSFSQLSAYAETTGNDIRLGFGDSHLLTLASVTNLNTMHDDLDSI